MVLVLFTTKIMGGVLRDDGFSFEVAEVDVPVGHPGKGYLGTVGFMDLMPSFLPSRVCLAGSL